MKAGLINRWERVWMRLAQWYPLRRISCRLAAVFRLGYKDNAALARLNGTPYVSWTATVSHPHASLGRAAFVGEDVVFFSADGSGSISIGSRSTVHRGVIVETGQNGRLEVGDDTHIQPRCQFSAYVGSIVIGSEVQIAPACAFYPYNHATTPGILMREQPLVSVGDICIEDDVWIGYGVIVLENVRIRRGAVISAGAVVRSDVPENAIVAGDPARVIGFRSAMV